MFVAFAGACGTDPAPDERGADCRRLAEAAQEASACDPELGALAEVLMAEPDEHRCRRAIRSLLAGPTSPEPRVRSLLETPPLPDLAPLRPDEIRALGEIVYPARVVLTSDLPPEPGVPPTSAEIDRVPLENDGEGRLRGEIAPGLRSLEVRHAGEQTSYCVDLRACETLAVTAHGAKLARHPDVIPGPCK